MDHETHETKGAKGERSRSTNVVYPAQDMLHSSDRNSAGLVTDSTVDTLSVSEYAGVDDCLGYRPGRQAGVEEVVIEWGVVKGVYKQGVVESLEPFPVREGAAVFVLFPEPVPKQRGHSIWQQIKKEMAKEMPDLEQQTMAEKRREFDRLSRLIAEQLPYGSPEELERAMRGDE